MYMYIIMHTSIRTRRGFGFRRPFRQLLGGGEGRVATRDFHSRSYWIYESRAGREQCATLKIDLHESRFFAKCTGLGTLQRVKAGFNRTGLLGAECGATVAYFYLGNAVFNSSLVSHTNLNCNCNMI